MQQALLQCCYKFVSSLSEYVVWCYQSCCKWTWMDPTVQNWWEKFLPARTTDWRQGKRLVSGWISSTQCSGGYCVWQKTFEENSVLLDLQVCHGKNHNFKFCHVDVVHFVKFFLAHLSRRLKWVFLFKISPLSFVGVVVNFEHFHLLLQNHWANFN